MTRYVDPTGTKFWEIERDGATIVRTSGKVGSKGRVLKRTYASPLHARYEYERFVGYKTHTLSYAGDAPARNLVDEFPFDDDARLVHADALQSKGDPLGELVVLQHSAATTQDFQASQRLQREIDELVAANAETWFGDLWRARSLFEFDWRLGRLRRVKLAPDSVHWDTEIARLLPDVPLVYLLGTFLEALFELDIARSLEELELGAAGTLDMQHTVQTVVELAPPSLRRLELARGGARLASYSSIDDHVAELAAMRFPNLEEFCCDMDLSPESLREIATADWPKLQTLSFAMFRYSVPGLALDDEPPGLVELQPLFENAGALRSLEIKTATPAQLAQAIIDGGALAKLDELVIRSKRVMDPDSQARLQRFNPNASYIQMPAYSMRPG